MTHSRKAPKPRQLSIDDLDLGVERIPGAVPPDPQDAERIRAERDAQLRASYKITHLVPPTCWPEQRIHVYAGAGPCQCKEIK